MMNPLLPKIFQLEETTINNIQEAFQNGNLTSKELVCMYMERISLYDRQGPGLNTILELNPDSIHIAEALDEERKRKGARSPLHGIPVLIKDNIDTNDKMHTSAGSLALKNAYAARDAFIVKKLREAGAVILGKTNMTEWANFMTENMTNGYSSRGGQVLNPYGPGTFDVSGSSSGSGAAIAANLATVAVGTETSGSILCPSYANNIVGIKPTVGLLSRTGIIPISNSQDTAGPMARTVTDAAILLGILAGADEEDPATLKSIEKAKNDYTAYLDKGGLKGARIGFAKKRYLKMLSNSQQQIMENAISIMEQRGATIIELNETSPLEHEEGDFAVLLYEFKSGINDYLKRLHPAVGVRTLKDIIQFNKDNAKDCLKFGQTLLLESEQTSGTLTEPEYIKSRLNQIVKAQKLGIDKVIEEHQLDAVLYPGEFGYEIGAKAGYPSITVPAGFDDAGAPYGIILTGRAFSEPTLIRLGYAFEQASLFRKPPVLE